MEVVDKENTSNWTYFVNRFRKTKTQTNTKLESEEDQKQEENQIDQTNQTFLEEQQVIDETEKPILEEPQIIDENEQNFLDEQDKKFQKLGFTSTDKPIDEDEQKHKIERCISIIKKLHQKEIGSFSRLESISNYLTDGNQLLYEDEQYLREQYKELNETSGLNEDFDYKKSYVPNKDPSEPQTILIDDVEENPTDDFTSLGITIAKIIKDSTPHFTIGIYGEWGTGKTTLMRAI